MDVAIAQPSLNPRPFKAILAKLNLSQMLSETLYTSGLTWYGCLGPQLEIYPKEGSILSRNSHFKAQLLNIKFANKLILKAYKGYLFTKVTEISINMLVKSKATKIENSVSCHVMLVLATYISSDPCWLKSSLTEILQILPRELLNVLGFGGNILRTCLSVALLNPIVTSSWNSTASWAWAF